MKKIITTTFVLLLLTICGYSQNSAKNSDSPDAAMKSFINSIETKKTDVFLSFISPTKGLTIMNTIDQGDAGNVDNPMLDSKLTYKMLAADFKKKGDYYKDIFLPSPDSPDFHDAFAARKNKWKLGTNNKFMIVDEETGEPSNWIYVKWEKEGEHWYAVEVARPIS